MPKKVLALSVRAYIDHRRRQNVVETSVTQPPLFLPHFDVICDLLCTYQGLAATGGGRANNWYWHRSVACNRGCVLTQGSPQGWAFWHFQQRRTWRKKSPERGRYLMYGDIYCTDFLYIEYLPEEGYLRCSKRFDHGSHSIIFLLFEFKSVRWCWRWETQRNARVAFKPTRRSHSQVS